MLNSVERDSSAWLKIKEEVNNEIERLRNKMENNIDHENTLILRGQLKALRNMLKIFEPEDLKIKTHVKSVI